MQAIWKSGGNFASDFLIFDTTPIFLEKTAQ